MQKRHLPIIRIFFVVAFLTMPMFVYARNLSFIDRVSLEVYCFFSNCHGAAAVRGSEYGTYDTQDLHEKEMSNNAQQIEDTQKTEHALARTDTTTNTVADVHNVRNVFITQTAPRGMSFHYDPSSVREKDGFLSCKHDGDLLQWQRRNQQWECVAPVKAVFDGIDTRSTDIRSDGALHCRQDGDALLWNDVNKQWACRQIRATQSTDDQDLIGATLSGTTLKIDIENGASVSVDLASIDTDSDTHLSEAEVDAFVSNNGFLTAEVDGDATNELIMSASLTGSTLSITDAGGTTTVSLASLLDNTDTLASLTCSAGEVAQWDGATWTCAAAAVDTDDQFIDTLSLTGTTLNISLDGDGVAPSTLDLSALVNDADASITNEIITASSYTPATNILSITEAGVMHNFDLSELDNAGLLALTDIDTEAELEGLLTDVTNVFTNNDTIDISDNTNLVGGTGINLVGDTINLADTAVTTGTYGNTTNVPQITVDQQGRITGITNVAITDNDTTYTAGNGLNLTGTQFAINSPTCAGTDKLQWNGTAFVCSADVDTDTTYTAGTGLSLTGTVFSLNSGINNLSDVDTATTPPTNGDLLTWNGTNWVTTDSANYTNNIYTADGTLTGDRNVSFAGHNLAFDNDKLFINGNNGNVGIGTNNPNHKLEVRGSATGASAVFRVVNTASSTWLPAFELLAPNMNSGQHNYFAIGRNPALYNRAYMDFYYNGNHSANNRMSFGFYGADNLFNVLANGNIGVGTTSPTDRLHIDGDIRVTGGYKDSNNDIGTAGQILSSTNTGTDWIDAPTSASGSIDTHSDVDTTTNAPINNQVLAWDGNNWVPTTAALNNIYMADGQLAGNRTVSLNGNDLYFAGSGNVGIGTTSPSHKLQVNGNVRATRFHGANGTAGSPTFRFDSDTDTGMFRGATNELAFTTAGNERVRIDNSGNVGIGTTNPSRRLDVRGNGYFERDLVVQDSEIIYSERSYKDSALGYELIWNLLQTEKTNDPNDKDFATITSGTGWKQGFPITRWKVGNEATNGQHYGYTGYFPGDNWHPYFRINTGGDDDTPLVMGTHTKDAVFINGHQDVGIGDWSTGDKLHIQGDMRLTGAFKDANNQSGTVGQILSSTNTGTDWIDASALSLGSIDSHSDVDTTTNAPTNNQVLSWDGNNWVPTTAALNNIYMADGQLAGARTVDLDNHDLIFDNAGVGTGELHIKSGLKWLELGETGTVAYIGSAYGGPSANDHPLALRVGDVEHLRIDTLGNIGIGNTAPTDKVHITGDIRVTGGYKDSSNDIGTAGQILSSTNTGTDWIDASSVGTDDQNIQGSSFNTVNNNLTIGIENGSAQAVDLSVLKDIYTTGNGLTLSGSNVFSINAPTCAGTDKLQWNGTAFVCSADVDTDTDTLYTAGSGLDLAGTVFSIANGGVTATHLNASVAGNGLIGGGGTALSVGAGNGITVNANDITIDTTTTGTTATTSSNSGLEVTADGVSLLRGCADGETLKWNATTTVWECGADRATYNSVTTADYTNNSTTLTDVPDMSFPIGANEDWYFEMNMQINADSNDDTRARINCPTGATGTWSVNDIESANSQGNLGCNVTSGRINAGNSSEPYRVQGLIQNGATAGTVQLQLRENTAADVTNGITIFANSVLQAWKISGADFAEIYYTDDDGVTEGTIVSSDPARHAGVVRATQNTARTMLGVISTDPGHVIGETSDVQHDRPVPLALSGRVPVRVSGENGPIAAGDRITISTTPGVGMRATDAGYTIGTAITAYDGNDEGTILAFVENQWFPGITPGQTEDSNTQEGGHTSGGDQRTTEESFREKMVAGFVGALTWTQDVFTVAIDAIFEAPTAFLDRVTFMDRVTFADHDIAGTATIKEGDDTVDVHFEIPYTFTPVVTVTPQDVFVQFAISDVSVDGFTIRIADDRDEDVVFSWIALAVTPAEDRDMGDDNTAPQSSEDADDAREDVVDDNSDDVGDEISDDVSDDVADGADVSDTQDETASDTITETEESETPDYIPSSADSASPEQGDPSQVQEPQIAPVRLRVLSGYKDVSVDTIAQRLAPFAVEPITPGTAQTQQNHGVTVYYGQGFDAIAQQIVTTLEDVDASGVAGENQDVVDRYAADVVVVVGDDA